MRTVGCVNKSVRIYLGGVVAVALLATAVAVFTTGERKTETVKDNTNPCAVEALADILCPEDGTVLSYTGFPRDVFESKNAFGRTELVLEGPLLPAMNSQAELIDLSSEVRSSTGDPVLDRFTLEAQRFMDRTPVGITMDMHAAPGVDKNYQRAITYMIPVVARFFPGLHEPFTFPFIITDASDKDLSWARSKLNSLGCEFHDVAFNRGDGQLHGAFHTVTGCSGGPGIYLDLAQFDAYDFPANYTSGMETVADELLTILMRYAQPGAEAGKDIPFWLWEGFQTIPFAVYGASMVDAYFTFPVEQLCVQEGLSSLATSRSKPGSALSCVHSLGSSAVALLIARVGMDNVIAYFTEPVEGRSMEERFERMAGESLEEFGVRFENYITDLTTNIDVYLRLEPRTTDLAEYTTLAVRWLS